MDREKQTLTAASAPVRQFQSAPGRWTGRNPSPVAVAAPLLRFNPLPADGPGETKAPLASTVGTDVSIRSRPMDREKPDKTVDWIIETLRFNPLPADGPGETRR